jgi:hypothetical protein
MPLMSAGRRLGVFRIVNDTWGELDRETFDERCRP